MKFGILILNILVFVSSNGIAQSTKYSKLYDFYNNAEYADKLIFLDDSNYLVPTIIFQYPNEDTLGYTTTITKLVKFNQFGDTVKVIDIHQKHHQILLSRPLKINDKIIVSGTILNVVDYHNGNIQNYIYTRIYNLDLELTDSSFYKLDSGLSFVTNITQQNDSSYLIFGQTCNDSTQNCSVFLTSLNLKGDTLWNKIIKESITSFDRSNDLLIDSSNNIIISTSFTSELNNYYKTTIYKLDKNGNIKNKHTVNEYRRLILNSILQYNNNTIILSGNYHAIANKPQGYLYSIDSNLKFINKKIINNFYEFNILNVIKNYNSIYILGFVLNNSTSIGKNVIYHINERFDTLRSFVLNKGTSNSTSIIYNIYPTSDNGFLGVGISTERRIGNLPQDLWIVKMDSTGCFVENCFSNVEIEKLENLLVFPNPSCDYISLIHHNDKIFKYEIYNSSGKLMLSNSLISDEIDIKELNDGVYIIKFISTTKIHYTRFSKISK